jgi:GNAT superfamily N-acetyltransferase
MKIENYEFRLATIADLVVITAWLMRELDEGDRENFCKYIDVIAYAQMGGALTVLALRPGGEPIAFYVQTLGCLAILEVRPGYRRQGYGRALVEHEIDEARATGSAGLLGLCLTVPADGFLTHLGFELIRSRHVAHLLGLPLPSRRHRELPDASVPVRIQLSTMLHGLRGGKVHETRASRDGDVYHLNDEFVDYADDRSALVTVRIDGEKVLCVEPWAAEAYGFVMRDHWVRCFELRIPAS